MEARHVIFAVIYSKTKLKTICNLSFVYRRRCFPIPSPPAAAVLDAAATDQQEIGRPVLPPGAKLRLKERASALQLRLYGWGSCTAGSSHGEGTKVDAGRGHERRQNMKESAFP